MGIPERKEKQKLEIQKMILEASMKLFIEEGFEKVSIRRIADIIEYSPTTIYLYFKDKNQILYQLCEIGFQKMAEYNQGLREIKNPLLRLYKMGENYIQFGLANPEYYDLMFIQPAPMEVLEESDCVSWHSGDLALEGLKGIIEECMAEGLIAKADLGVVAMAIWGLVHGLVSLANRRRLNKLVSEGQVVASMHQAITWLLNSIDKTR